MQYKQRKARLIIERRLRLIKKRSYQWVYEIIEPDIINIDVNAQRNEAIEFANEINDLDEGTTQGTTEGNRELEKEIEREEETSSPTTNSLKEEEIEIDLSFNSIPTTNTFSSSLKEGIVAGPILNEQNRAPIEQSGKAQHLTPQNKISQLRQS